MSLLTVLRMENNNHPRIKNIRTVDAITDEFTAKASDFASCEYPKKKNSLVYELVALYSEFYTGFMSGVARDFNLLKTEQKYSKDTLSYFSAFIYEAIIDSDLPYIYKEANISVVDKISSYVFSTTDKRTYLEIVKDTFKEAIASNKKFDQEAKDAEDIR